MTIDLSDTLRQLITGATPADRRTRLTTSALSGLALAYTPAAAGGGPHRLTLSRVGRWPDEKDIQAATRAIRAAEGVTTIQQGRPRQVTDRHDRRHYCLPLKWQRVAVRDFFSLSPAEQARLRQAAKRK